MLSKLCLIIGLFLFLALLVSANNEEQSLSQQASSIRIKREADPGRRNKNKKAKRRNKGKGRNNGKKNKRKNKNKKRTNKGSRGQGRMVDGKCLESATTAMSRWRNQVANFMKQKTRIEKQAEIAEKKSGKKAVFALIAKKLIDVGGGNKSALTCSGSADSDGAKQLSNLTITLEECGKEVNMTCNSDNFPKANMTAVDACTASVTSFETEAQKCYDLSKEATAEDACTCWTNADMMKYSDEVKSCKVEAVSDIAKGLKACKAAFSKCRQYEDAAISTIQTCSQSADQLKAKAEALTKNKEALTDVKAKIAKATSSASSRAPATDCAGFLSLVLQSKCISRV